MSEVPLPIPQYGMVLWTGIPTTCAGCGAAVDQSEVCRSPHPACRYCRAPLPCTPSVERSAHTGGTHVIAELHLLTKQEGGRHTPVFDGYRPDLRFASATVRGTISFDVDHVMVMPGDTVGCGIDLADVLPLAPDLPFDVLEGDRLVGRGIVHLVL